MILIWYICSEGLCKAKNANQSESKVNYCRPSFYFVVNCYILKGQLNRIGLNRTWQPKRFVDKLFWWTCTNLIESSIKMYRRETNVYQSWEKASQEWAADLITSIIIWKELFWLAKVLPHIPTYNNEMVYSLLYSWV